MSPTHENIDIDMAHDLLQEQIDDPELEESMLSQCDLCGMSYQDDEDLKCPNDPHIFMTD